MQKTKQLHMTFGTRGGWRPGAGRKAVRGRKHVPHRKRPILAPRYPVHITLKVCRELRSLRTKKRYQAIRRAFVAGCVRDGFRIVDWSIQGDHVHLIGEAKSARALSRGMQGFKVRVARSLNRLAGRRGAVFVERYHCRQLKTPREVRAAKCYVINNARRHAAQRGELMGACWADPFSSWAWFEGWKDVPAQRLRGARKGPESERPVAEPKTWLLRVGWRRHGLIRLDEVPGIHKRKKKIS